MNNKAFFKLSYGLYVVSSSCDGKDSACIANTFVQVTSEPARVCITLNKNNYTTSLIENSCFNDRCWNTYYVCWRCY